MMFSRVYLKHITRSVHWLNEMMITQHFITILIIHANEWRGKFSEANYVCMKRNICTFSSLIYAKEKCAFSNT